MYLLDTNVISELRRPERTAVSVAQWAENVDPGDLFISVITILELEEGVLRKERQDPTAGLVLRAWLNNRVLPAFHGRILPIDVKVVIESAKLQVPDRKPDRDCLIAATALVHSLIVVTRNIADFQSTSVKIINPWD